MTSAIVLIVLLGTIAFAAWRSGRKSVRADSATAGIKAATEGQEIEEDVSGLSDDDLDSELRSR